MISVIHIWISVMIIYIQATEKYSNSNVLGAPRPKFLGLPGRYKVDVIHAPLGMRGGYLGLTRGSFRDVSVCFRCSEVLVIHSKSEKVCSVCFSVTNNGSTWWISPRRVEPEWCHHTILAQPWKARTFHATLLRHQNIKTSLCTLSKKYWVMPSFEKVLVYQRVIKRHSLFGSPCSRPNLIASCKVYLRPISQRLQLDPSCPS